MAETSYLWDNPGTGDSPALGYGNSLLSQVIFRMLIDGTGDQGVLRHWLNELEVTDGGVDTADVDTGAAICYGVWFESDAVENVNINAYRGGNCLIVVRASWAAQTARVVARAVGALTQTPGVTYEIPLANVAIDGAGAITLVTDTRDYCEFSTDLWPLSIQSDHIAADAAVIAKLIDQTRWVDRSSANMIPDATNPATWIVWNTIIPYHNLLEFADAVTDEAWLTFRVPADFSGPNLVIYIYPYNYGVNNDVRFTYSYWTAAAGGALANTSGTVSYTVPATPYEIHPVTLCTLAPTAGDIVHLRIGRDGAHVADTSVDSIYIMQARAVYTADS